ncbi:ABC transporter permease [Acidothermaceae bacterium B102]|nr:ABC transporter permease [Acidothermaceae bacterium B102]
MTVLADRPAAAVPRVGRGQALLRARELGICLAIILVFGLTTLKNSGFAGVLSVEQLLTGSALIALLAVGETMVIVTRNVDLSVGSVLGLSAYLVGDFFKHNPHAPILLGFVIGIGIGALVGAVNGVVTTFFRVPSLVVTLAALYIVRGILAVIVNGRRIESDSIPDAFQKIGYENVPGIDRLPWLAVLVIVVVAIAAYTMKSFRWARDIYAIGSNPEAAALAGLPVARRVFTAFVISGALAGLGGALFLAEFATVDNTGGTGYELLVVSAVVVGGVAIFGGSGTAFGAALGAVLLNMINQALGALGVSSFWTNAVAGGLLLLAIAFDRWVGLRVARSLRTGRGAPA